MVDENARPDAVDVVLKSGLVATVRLSRGEAVGGEDVVSMSAVEYNRSVIVFEQMLCAYAILEHIAEDLRRGMGGVPPGLTMIMAMFASMIGARAGAHVPAQPRERPH